jgi:hypothetical protein
MSNKNMDNINIIKNNDGETVYQDASTGEIMEGLPVFIKKSAKLNRSTIMLFQKELELIPMLTIKDQKTGKEKLAMQGNDYRILYTLLSHVDYENWITISQKELAKHLGLDKSTVSKSLKKMKDLYIFEEELDNGFTSLRLNPRFGWKGRVSNLLKEESTRKEKIKDEITRKHLEEQEQK